MGFYDFLNDLPHYVEHGSSAARMNARHEFLIADFAEEIRGAKVLDLGAHDGRWCYGFAGAGAASVVGIEGRPELVEKFSDYPDASLRAKVELRVDDIFEGIRAEIARGETYDIVGVFGILYHIMDHFALFQLLRDLKPKLVIVDSEFVMRDNAIVLLIQERTDVHLNAVAQYPGQEVAVKGAPSFKAMEMIANALNYDIEWSDWGRIAEGNRGPVGDYYRPKNQQKRRATCALRLRDR
jgi:hypothetical protein